MDSKTLKAILRDHRKWLDSNGGKRADLKGIDLRGANLQGANLFKANFQEANLQEVDLRGAYLQGANLQGADLQGAYLQGANLREADLQGAYLQGAYLRGANLFKANFQEAYLQGAYLQEANLQGANLREAKFPSPEMVLLASWGEVSDDLTVELMRYDASNHPNPKAFDIWASGGPCPYDDETDAKRAANFCESRDLWSMGPSLRASELMRRVLEEKCNG